MPEVPLCGGCDNSDTGDCDACLRYMEYVRKRNKAVVNELLK